MVIASTFAELMLPVKVTTGDENELSQIPLSVLSPTVGFPETFTAIFPGLPEAPLTNPTTSFVTIPPLR